MCAIWFNASESWLINFGEVISSSLGDFKFIDDCFSNSSCTIVIFEFNFLNAFSNLSSLSSNSWRASLSFENFCFTYKWQNCDFFIRILRQIRAARPKVRHYSSRSLPTLRQNSKIRKISNPREKIFFNKYKEIQQEVVLRSFLEYRRLPRFI